jgi:hypothetical protein
VCFLLQLIYLIAFLLFIPVVFEWRKLASELAALQNSKQQCQGKNKLIFEITVPLFQVVTSEKL